MLKYALVFIVLLHGLIHFMGFAKAFGYGNITQLTQEIPKPMGMLWLITALLFLVTAAMLVLSKDLWWIIGLAAVVLSQVLILMVWQDASYGTIANVIVLAAIVLAWIR